MTRAISLTGTPVEEPEKRRLRAGDLTATFDAGGLRWIRWKGAEVLRALQFLVRTPGWGTPAPRLSDLELAETPEGFRIRWRADYGTPGAGLVVRIALEGSATGRLTARARIEAEAPFQTNRTGFVLLHPLDGVAGREVAVEHASATAGRLVIPLQISPGQPVQDLRAITHAPREGLTVETRLDGDIFETEDHRNWSDASFKTYSRPIGLPYPYLLTPAEPVEQAVTVTITDTGSGGAIPASAPARRVPGTRLPALALALDRATDATAALPHAELLRALGPARLLLRHDRARGDGAEGLADVARLLAATGFTLELQAITASPDDAGAADDLARLAADLAAAGLSPAEVSAFAKVDEASFQPGAPRPPHASEPALAAALARHFPQARRGGGTPAFFTEFNRKRPEPALWEFLSFATTPLVHASDDASVLETLEALPHILGSARTLAGDRPLAVGPTGIGARLNPYGPAVTDNAPDAREGMAAADPRQRGLLAAAWHVGYLAQIAGFGVERFAFGAPTGPFGLISTPQPRPRAWWDAAPEGAAYPLYHVARWIARAAGRPAIEATHQGGLARLVWHGARGREALLANLTDRPQELDLGDLAGARGQILDVATFERAALRPRVFATETGALGPRLRLDAYAVAFLADEARA